MISAVAEQYAIHPQTLRLYEREGLLKPSRSEGNTRLYTDEDLERLEVILHLTRDLGVNLAGRGDHPQHAREDGRDAVADPGVHRHPQSRAGGALGPPAGARAQFSDPGGERAWRGARNGRQPPVKVGYSRIPGLGEAGQ